ncbi:hypothetical protein PanWU01x14_025700, partial [Parasponia andersonii]
MREAATLPVFDANVLAPVQCWPSLPDFTVGCRKAESLKILAIARFFARRSSVGPPFMGTNNADGFISSSPSFLNQSWLLIRRR